MLSKEDNDLVTQTDAGTPCGELMRRYWHPVALAREIPPGSPPKPVRLLGEDLVLFRTKKGEPGLMDLHCPHRGTDLSYGRIEDDGLRCLYHGWKMGLDGRCLDQPGEPKGSNFKDKVRHAAYPCREAGGLIMTYMGKGPPPPLPNFPIFSAPPSHVWSSKLFHECNYLQGTEGEVDSQHLSYLHRMASPNKAQNEAMELTDFLVAVDEAPTIEFEPTSYGIRLFATRLMGDGNKYVRVTNFVMPYTGCFDGGPLIDPRKANKRDNLGYWMHWHVPIDDTHHWKYIVAHCYDQPIDPEFQARMIESETTPDFDHKRNKSNRYLQDRAEMDRLTFLGMGYNFEVHDRFATESQRPISHRWKEHLGASDRGVTAMRKLMLQAIRDNQEGKNPVMTDPGVDHLADLVVVSETVPECHDKAKIWRDFLAARRAKVPAGAK
jgi:phenylpropionate dioxygenase-like ring-hydroxylating dioxygenase large terminal subunit